MHPMAPEQGVPIAAVEAVEFLLLGTGLDGDRVVGQVLRGARFNQHLIERSLPDSSSITTGFCAVRANEPTVRADSTSPFAG